MPENLSIRIVRIRGKSSIRSQSTLICRVQCNVWRLPKYWLPTPFPPSECVLPPHQRRGVTHSPSEVGKRSDWSIFQYRFDLPIVSVDVKFLFLYRASVSVHFKFRFLDRAIVSVHFKFRFFHARSYFLVLSSDFCIRRLCWSVLSSDSFTTDPISWF